MRRAVLCAAFLLLGAVPAPSGAAELSDKLVPSAGAHFGIFGGPPRSGRGWRGEMPYLERVVARRFDLDRSYSRWDDRFPAVHEQDAVRAGRIPITGWVALTNRGIPVPWRLIASGAYDGVIRARADAVRRFRHKMMVLFHHEPEDDLRANGTPAEFRAAFRRVVEVFRARGATNAVFVWNLMAHTFRPGGQMPEDYYPGDDVVDWVAADGYNWFGSDHIRGQPWRSFEDIFTSFNAWAAARGKPAMVAEFGVLEDRTTPDHGRKARWLADVAQTAQAWPNLKAIIYFQGQGWNFDSSPQASEAFRALGRHPQLNPRSVEVGLTPLPPKPLPPPPPVTAAPNPAPTLIVKSRRRISRRRLLRGIDVRVSVSRPVSTTVELRRRRRPIGRRSARVAGSAELRIRPSRQGRGVLRRTRARRLALVVTARADGTHAIATVRRTVRLRATTSR